eukprot:8674799-Pyramimonas_sp.AAC.1
MFGFLIGAEEEAPAPAAPVAPVAAAAPPAAPVAAAAAPPAPAPAAPPRPPPVRPRGVRLTLAKARHVSRRLREERACAVSVANPTVANKVSSEIFNFRPLMRGSFVKESHLTMNVSSAVQVDKRRQHDRLKMRGVVSHHGATKQALEPYLTNVVSMICNDVTDEASMWVRKPMTAKDKEARAASDTRNGRSGRQKAKAVGRN